MVGKIVSERGENYAKFDICADGWTDVDTVITTSEQSPATGGAFRAQWSAEALVR